MDIVTVTCLRDVDAIVRQAQSIQKFVDPCTHRIIVNEPVIDEKFWYELLTPYYTNHELIISFPDWNEWAFNRWERFFYSPYHPMGYKTQQVHKLLISEQLDDDYLITDSGNFFVKRTNVESWRSIVGSGSTLATNDMLSHKDTLLHYSLKLDVDVPEYLLDIASPFVIKLEVIRSLKNLRKTLRWFQRLSHCPQSEYLLYSLLAYKVGLIDGKTKLKNTKSILYHDPMLNTFEISEKSKWEVMRLHRSFIEKLTDKERSHVNSELSKIGITSEFSVI